MMRLVEYAPVLAAFGAVVAAALAWMAARKKPQLDEASADKIRAEIAKDQEAARRESALANAKRDRYLVRMENWAFNDVRPAWRQAVILTDQQNDLLVELAARADIPYAARHLPLLPDPPLLDDE